MSRPPLPPPIETPTAPVARSDDEHLARVVASARMFAGCVTEAVDAGVSQARLLPALIVVLRESGISVPGLPRL